MNTSAKEPDNYRRERLAARTAKYSTEVARLRALAGLSPARDDDQPTEEDA